MEENTYVENMRAPALPQVPFPNVLYFKEGGSLATHPLSCHPRGCLAIEKVTENERTSREKKKHEASPKSFSNFNQ